jgi:hypothetical protein
VDPDLASLAGKIWRSQNGEWRFQQESTDEQKFATIPSVYPPLKPIHEGVQAEFGE